MNSATQSRALAPLTAPWPVFEQDEIDAVVDCLRSGHVNYWTGTACRQFESEFSSAFGVRHSIATSNGTVAIEVALHALQLEQGSEIVVSPRTFLASATSPALQGLKPVFADVDPDSGNVTARSIEAVLSERTRSILCVHLAGWPCDMPEIMDLANRNGLRVIEDCAQSHGAKIDGRYAGTYGHINAWSFCQDKIISTGGEGGMITTEDDDLWSRAWSFKDHGKSWDAIYNRTHPVGFRWIHESLGTNGRLTEPQAAIGRRQLEKLPAWLQHRRANADILVSELQTHSCLRVPVPRAGIEHAYYRLYAYVVPDQIRAGWSRDRLMTAIVEAGVPCMSGSCPEVYLERAFDGTGSRPEQRLPVAKALGETSICFLVHPTLTQEQVRRQVEVIRPILEQASM